jgi:dihydrofolate synthase/folylpolyglutamate synthase
VNNIDADCAVISSIDLDHMAYLGDTREQIAKEKAGIFRAHKAAVCADPHPPQSLLNEAKKLNVDLWTIGQDFNFSGDQQQWTWFGRGRRFSGLAYPALRGANQLLNAAAVIAVLSVLRKELPVAVQDIRHGLAQVELAGRFQILPGRPTIILDVAHNPHAAAVLSRNLDSMGFYPYTWAVFGAMQDKDIVGVLKQVQGQIHHWCLTELPTSRAAKSQELKEALYTAGYQDDAAYSCTDWANPAAAYQHAIQYAGQGDRILVFGSFYTVAGVLSSI